MKSLIPVFGAALFAVTSFAADAVPAFNATLTVGKETRFVLIGADGKASGFLKLGESFEGYDLKAYDPKGAALDLEKNGKVSHVTLASDATIVNGGANAATTQVTIADATEVLDKMHFEQMLDRTLAGIKRQQLSAMKKMTGPTPPGVEPGEISNLQQRMVDEMMSQLNAADLKGEVAKIYSQLLTKQELDAMAAFNASPMGQSLLDKQPDITEKMQELMMTKMMSAMPKIQQMAREFGAQVKAKQQAAAAANAASTGSATPVQTSAPAPAPKQ